MLIFKSVNTSIFKMRFYLLLIFICSTAIVKAEITLPNIFSDKMVLQREAEVLLYGWADPNEEFEIYTGWNDKTVAVKTGNNAKWQVTVQTPEAGGPYSIKFTGKGNEIIFTQVLIGEVWLCSGQSNMEWSANSTIDNKEFEIANANNDLIRLFTVQKRTALHPLEDVEGTWEACTSETMPDFSAVAYFFAKKVATELNVPIGLVDASWGASCAEVWTPENVFESFPELANAHKAIKPNKWVTIEPSVLYNAMIAPLTNFKISGVLWYQGESNTANASSYQNLFTHMITSWRTAWQYDFPFYYVQIAPFKYGGTYEGGIVRDQQRRTLSLKNTGMAMTSDICTVDDIHPQNKQDVGLRLANIALKYHFNAFDGEVNGPLYDMVKVQGNAIEVSFHNDEGMYVKGKQIDHFEISGENGVWYPAKASLKKGVVRVSAKEVKLPVHVRYAWKSTAIGNLFNAAGLPASTFTSE
ncbi:sialate O-acetylesterase [Maribacter sedimenticola]|uniref:Sialate O-acetylesterase n=2 Tax=Maribacter sedimenticola TaxID=228956 RepID=A0ABY1SF27_9FLAO|nr:sialate O-acetylesterase [Maribacter sedimenticola]